VDIGPNRDLLGDLTDAVRAQGIHMGIYYSLYEWYNPLWLTDRDLYVDKHMFPQFKDVVTRYRPSVIFADGE
jgi:alpha-L-fucosidase